MGLAGEALAQLWGGSGAQQVHELGSCPVPGHCQAQLTWASTALSAASLYFRNS